jgi:poly(3-hydroxybutyrate) depolymerase
MRLKALLAVPALVAGTALASCAPATPARNDKVTSGSSGFAYVHVPSNPTHVGVVALHSLYATYAQMITEGWSMMSDQQHFVAIYPDRGSSWNAGGCCGDAAATNRDDVTWLANLILQMKLRYKLTTIYLTGFSNGGMMVERLLAERPSVSNRMAVWGATPMMPKAGYWSGTGIIYDGFSDATVPWAGGKVTIANITYNFRPYLTTPSWLIGAHLKGVRVPGYGHTPMPSWPAVAWTALSG